MKLLILSVFCISSIGYFQWIRKFFRLSFSYAVFMSTCAIMLLMMAAGLLHIMRPMIYIILTGGFILILRNIVSIKPFGLQAHLCKRLKKLYFCNEYILWSIAIGGAYLYFSSYKAELGSPDIWAAWYDHFYYMVQHNHWTDSNYINYASGYAMIGNSFCYFMANMLSDYGTHIYIYSYFIIFIGFMMPVFRLVVWHKTACVEAAFILFAWFLYKLDVENSPVYSTALMAGAVLLFVYDNLKSTSAFIHLKNGIFIVLGGLLIFLFMEYQLNFSFYPIDAVLGALFGGALIFLVYDIILRSYRNTYIMILPLAVLPLLKPTGIMPAIILAVVLGFVIIFRLIKERSTDQSTTEKLYNRKKILRLTGLLLTVLTPIIIYNLWGLYASKANFQFQHEVNPRLAVGAAIQQIKYGVSPQDKVKYQKKVNKMLYYWPDYGKYSVEKRLPEKAVDRLTAHIVTVYNLDFDQSFSSGKVHPQVSHVYTINILLIIFITVSCCFLKRRKLFILAVASGSLIYFLLAAVIQCYITPMFTDIPGLFRYLWPGLVPLWISAWLVLVLNLKQNLWWGTALTALFIYCFMPLFFSRGIKEFSKTAFENNSSLGMILLTRCNADNFSNVVFASASQDAIINKFLQDRLNFPKKKNIYRKISDIPAEKRNQSTVMAIAHDKQELKKYKMPSDLPEGLYKISILPDNKVKYELLFHNPEAVKLLNQLYSFSDPESFRHPPIIQRNVDAHFSGLKNATSPNNKWRVWYNKKRNPSDIYEVCNSGSNGNFLRIKADKPVRIENVTHFYTFKEDKLTLKCVVDKKLSISAHIYLRLQQGDKFIPVQAVKMKHSLTQLSPDRFLFEGTLDLAEYKHLSFDHFMFALNIPAPSNCAISEVSLSQYLSGKLNLQTK